MRLWQLAEDKLPPKLPVILSPEIYSEISTIEDNNRDNINAIAQWKDSLSVIINHVSNPTIAWDNVGKFRHQNNGEIHATIFGHNIAYPIETDKSGKNHVDIFYFDLYPEKYGLIECRGHRRKALIITKSNLKRIIAESIKKVLLSE